MELAGKVIQGKLVELFCRAFLIVTEEVNILPSATNYLVVVHEQIRSGTEVANAFLYLIHFTLSIQFDSPRHRTWGVAHTLEQFLQFAYDQFSYQNISLLRRGNILQASVCQFDILVLDPGFGSVNHQALIIVIGPLNFVFAADF